MKKNEEVAYTQIKREMDLQMRRMMEVMMGQMLEYRLRQSKKEGEVEELKNNIEVAMSQQIALKMQKFEEDFQKRATGEKIFAGGVGDFEKSIPG